MGRVGSIAAARLFTAPVAAAITAATMAATLSCASSPNDPSPIDVADFPARARDINCTADVACGIYPDVDTCRASTMLNTSQILADIAAGIIGYDGAAAAACLYEISVTYSPTCRLSEQGSLEPLSCSLVFTGTVTDGGSCIASNECVSQRCDTTGCGNMACCAGTCMGSGPPLAGSVAIGAVCTSRSDCVVGAFCDVSLHPALCAAQKGLGEGCQLSEECAVGTACILPLAGGSAMICAKPPGEGEACGGTASCDLGVDYCDPATMKCAPRVPVGGSCVTGGDSCVLYGACSIASRTCVARGRAGDLCTLTSLPCLGGLACIAGQCALPAAAVVCPRP